MQSLRKKTATQSTGSLTEIERLQSRAYLSVSFSSPVSVSTQALGISPVSAVLADFNGDHHADLVVANSTESVTYLSGNGDGTFSNFTTIPVAGSPVPLATGTFDSTGHLDIVTGTTATPGNVNLILGNGDGTFADADDISALTDNQSIAVGSFVTGGPEDVLTISDQFAPVDNAMLLIGNGAGGATAQAPFSLPFGSVSAVAVGDFNGDGNLDFAVADETNNSVTVFDGNGDGTFQAPQTFPTGPSPSAIVVGNFTGTTLTDGRPKLDLITADSTGGEVSYLANKGDGTFAAPVNTSVAGSPVGGGPTQIVTADFNNDGKTDLAALLSPGGTAQATVLLGNGDGSFTTGATLTTDEPTPTSFAVGDLNGDSLPDLVFVSSTAVTSLLNTTVVGTTASVTTLTSTALSVVAGGSVTLTATVTSPSGGATPTGSVDFDLNGSSIGTASLVDGTASLTTALSTAGNQPVIANYSGDSTYADSTSRPFTITVTPTATLTPSITRDSLPATVVGGTAAHGVVTVNVTNTTRSPIKGSTTVGIYASTDGLIDDTSVALGSVKRPLAVKAGASVPVTVPVKLLADMLPAGSYTLIARVLAPADTVSTATGSRLTIEPPVIALTEKFEKLNIASRAVAGSKTPAVALLRITNGGNITSAGTTTITLYVSQDGTVAAGTLITSITRKLAIRPNRSITVAVPLRRYPLVSDGNYSVVAAVTDPKAQVSTATSSSTVALATANIDLLLNNTVVSSSPITFG